MNRGLSWTASAAATVLAIFALALPACTTGGRMRSSAPPSQLSHPAASPADVSGYTQFRYSVPHTSMVPSATSAAQPSVASTATDELWVIQKPAANWPPAQDNDDAPGSGTLVCQLPEDDATSGSTLPQQVPVPLKHTEVNASITGYIASVTVRQEFHNPYSSKIEAVYVFPLPENAGVNEFIMTIGERKIRGIIREREEARQIYDQAKHHGHTASLMTQERPNIFTQHVANIEPGKAIDIDITYFSTLPFADGAYEFAFPMVVGPRFNPPGSSGGIGAVPRGGAGSSGHSTEVQYLRPQERSGHDIAISVDIDAGVAIDRIDSRSHSIRVARDSENLARAQVVLAAEDRIPNRDFVLRYSVAGEEIKSSLITQADPRGGGYFTLLLVPPRSLAELRRAPVEMIFVVDRSGSMSGRPIEQARDALLQGLTMLQPGDSFQIIDFAEDSSQFGPRPLEVTPQTIQRGRAYARSLTAGGGTMMVTGLRAALDFPHDPDRLRFVCFLTDGYIGNDTEILSELAQRLGDSRIFGLGVGSSVNRYLLAEMSRVGRGAVAYLGLTDSAAEIMNLFFSRISHPALADLAIDWGGAAVTDVVPARIPDLFVGRPVVLSGRYTGSFEGTIRVSGKAGGTPQELLIAADAASETRRGALSCVWARMKIGEIANTWLLDQQDLSSDVRQLALEYGLLSAFTSFVAVDSTARTEGDVGTTVLVPVPVPDGVQYNTTVGGRQ